MIETKHSRYGIRQQVLLITLLPLVVMTLILAGYFVSTRVDDNKLNLIERGETMSRLLAQASEFGLVSGLTHQLSALSQGPIQEADVADVIFINAEKHILYRSNDFSLQLDLKLQPNHQLNDHVWLFTTPVTTQGIIIGDSPETNVPQTERELLGWVSVAISTAPMHQRENNIVTNSLLILLGGLICTFVVAARFAQTLTKPIINLTSLVKKLEEGQLDARVDTTSYAELGSLEKGINLLAQQVQSSKQILESQVAQATAQLRRTMHDLKQQNAELQRARKHADQANMAKDNFLARMSHELRTPLTSILGFTNMLRHTDLSFEQQEHCRIINQTSTMLLSIIDDILDFAKLQADAIKLEKISFNPEQVIFEALEMQSQSAAAKGLELSYQVDDAAYANVSGDPTRLRQIATNLISNAIKFTDAGQILVFLQVIEETPFSKRMQLCVKDTGIGITAEQQELLFHAFVQADSSITRRFGGSGLGLVIVEKLVKLMQGSIELSSEVTRGTQICCSFVVGTQQAQQQTTLIASEKEVIIFDRHPESLKALRNITRPLVAKIQTCATIQGLEKTLSNVQQEKTSLIFGLSANPDIAHQQKQKIAEIFASFKGNILLLMPALVGSLDEFAYLGDLPRLTINSKPLHRDILSKWLQHPSINSNSSRASHVALQPLTNITAVIAEDNDFNRLLLKKMVESAGATVIEVSNGEQAVKAVQQRHPDIVIMDVHMPVMDGIEATKAIRKNSPFLPIIALTADVIVSEEQALHQAGVSRIEYKPIHDGELIRILTNLCEPKIAKTIQSLTKTQRPTEQSHQTDNPFNKEDLHEELISQANNIQQAFSRRDINCIRDHSHQLIGLAGLCELPGLESCSIELNEEAKTGDMRRIWQALWRLKRLIAHQQYLD
ncbi:ATP-binding protein [Amphritea sp. 1_MG-2023]|uniref:ATP-binding protein n=1 Tax=Amphritea sp. 1_MG-2023 TaxID=3062670 RepID=UPI0026E48213|nr:ATP-binding protein [Amphritea sp. 1_MG-2023]MDO6565219.1 ATP-binding protein [Amphritea sp. 1_MG-2023]